MEYSLKEEIYYEHKLIYLNNYTPFFSSLLIQYKETLDIELAPIFLERYSMLFHLLFFTYKLVLIPSSQSNIDRRGFNHLEEMFKDVSLKRVTGLKMKNELIQENRSALERYKMKGNFVYEGPKYKNILIVDDVVTTGSTLRGIYDCMFSQTNNIRLLSVAYKTLQKDKKL